MQAVLFDWDGTIVDSIERLFEAYAVVSARFGVRFDRATFRREFAPDWRLMYRRLGLREDAIERAGAAWVEAFEGERVGLFPGVREGLERLSAAGLELGLVTGGYREVVRPQLERHGVAGLFAVCVFGDDLSVGKPDPGPLLMAIDRLDGRIRAAAEAAPRGPSDRVGLAEGFDGGRPGRPPFGASIAYVGDALDDMRMAAAAGVHGVGIPSELCDADALLAAGAVEVAGSVAEWVDRLLATPGERV